MTLDLNKIKNIQFSDIDHCDYPDYSDAHVSYAEYDGEAMTEEQLDALNDEYRDFVYEKLMDWIF